MHALKGTMEALVMWMKSDVARQLAEMKLYELFRARFHLSFWWLLKSRVTVVYLCHLGFSGVQGVPFKNFTWSLYSFKDEALKNKYYIVLNYIIIFALKSINSLRIIFIIKCIYGEIGVFL